MWRAAASSRSPGRRVIRQGDAEVRAPFPVQASDFPQIGPDPLNGIALCGSQHRARVAGLLELLLPAPRASRHPLRQDAPAWRAGSVQRLRSANVERTTPLPGLYDHPKAYRTATRLPGVRHARHRC